MRIGFDAKRIFRNRTGLGNYGRNLVSALQEFFPNEEYSLFSPKPNTIDELHPGLKSVVYAGFFSSLKRLFFMEGILKKNKIEIFHGLSNEIPFLLKNSEVKTVVTIHDVIFKVYPRQYPLPDRLIYDYKTSHAVKNADAIIAISEATKKDLVKYYGADADKINVIYQCCDDVFLKPDNAAEDAEIKTKYNLPPSYVLFVGSFTQRKNLLFMAEAMLPLHKENNLHCVLVGKGDGVKEKLKDYALNNDISQYYHILENVPTADLPSIYRYARMLIYPSLYEGFGLPVLEAINCGCPVITSPVSSMPEAGGEGAVYFELNNLQSLTHAIKKLDKDAAFRNELIEKGKLHAAAFTRRRQAEQVHDVYLKLLQEK